MSRTPSLAATRTAASSSIVFAALGDRTRLGMLARLSSEGPLSSTKLGEGASFSRQAIDKHLEALARAGLVRSSRRGRERIWTLERRRLDVARRYLDRISAQWDEAIDRLKDLVEND